VVPLRGCRDAGAVHLARLLDPIAPPLCEGCGAHAGRSEPLCAACRGALCWLGPAPERAAGVPVWAPVAYDGPARALVSALKYRGAVHLAGTMAAHAAGRAPAGWLSAAVLVPVPLNAARRRRRGFNQAGLLVAELAWRTGLGLSDCLERGGCGTTQVGRGRSDRAQTIEGAVTVRPRALVPAGVLLVDDVVTTGATLAACAASLRAAGVRSIRAVAYARTPGR
jgi:ComF family protein